MDEPKHQIVTLVQSSCDLLVPKSFIAAADCTQERWDEFWNDRAKIGPAVTALLQLDGAYDDCFMARTLTRTGKHKTGSRHLSNKLRFFWQSFQHHVYIYTEKIGLLQTQLDKLPYVFSSESCPETFSDMRKSVTKTLKPLLRVRGQIVHEWAEDHRSINILGMLEILSLDASKNDIPEGYNDVGGHAREAAWEIREEMRRWEMELTAAHKKLVSCATKKLAGQVATLNLNYSGVIKPDRNNLSRKS